jgi:hypothetical protein
MADAPPAESAAAASGRIEASRTDASSVSATSDSATSDSATCGEGSPVDAFRDEVRGWLAGNLTGEFAAARGLGGPGREHEGFELRRAWERRLGAAGWTCLG